MSKKHIGRCALCGIEKELTFEHIPPRMAFNAIPTKTVSGDALYNSISEERLPWDVSGLPYKNQQGGMGVFSLCKQCNNDTGAWYGNDYVQFSQGINYVLYKNKAHTGQSYQFNFKELYPLRIIKQILSMVCSVNQSIIDDKRIKTLANFVLSKEAVSLDKSKYKICLYLSTSGCAKLCPLTVMVKSDTDIIVLSELSTFPLGIIIYFKYPNNYTYAGADITSFCDYKYDEKCSVEMILPVLETNNLFPEDYRTKEEILECININKQTEVSR
jgi:hypothetical protein